MKIVQTALAVNYPLDAGLPAIKKMQTEEIGVGFCIKKMQTAEMYDRKLHSDQLITELRRTTHKYGFKHQEN